MPVTFSCDLNNPELELAVDETIVTNDEITLAGYAWDTNKMKSVEIAVGSMKYSSAADGTNGDLNTFRAEKAASKPANTNWSKTFKVGSANSASKYNGKSNYLADGTYNFTITATDDVGKTKQRYVKVIVDTKVPVITPAAIARTASYLRATSYQFTGTASDTSPSSGISSINYQLYEINKANPGENDEWTPSTADGSSGTTSLSNGNWSQRFYNLRDGYSYKLKVWTADEAGNSSAADQYTDIITIDTTTPSSTLLGHFTMNLLQQLVQQQHRLSQ